MPTYDFRCKTCEHKETLITSITKKLSIPYCQACKAEMVRNYGSPGVTFKGQGFYSTDGKTRNA